MGRPLWQNFGINCSSVKIIMPNQQIASLWLHQYCLTCSVFAGSGWMPSTDMTCPRNGTTSCRRFYFGFNRSPSLRSLMKTSPRRVRCTSKVLAAARESLMNTKQLSHSRSLLHQPLKAYVEQWHSHSGAHALPT